VPAKRSKETSILNRLQTPQCHALVGADVLANRGIGQRIPIKSLALVLTTTQIPFPIHIGTEFEPTFASYGCHNAAALFRVPQVRVQNLRVPHRKRSGTRYISRINRIPHERWL